MFRELVEAGTRFQKEGVLDPLAYKRKEVNWFIEVPESGDAVLTGPYRGRDARRVKAPDRQRSGGIGPDNLKPYLLLDDARYALGIAEVGKEREAELAHQSFVALMEQAAQAIQDPDAERVLGFLRAPLPQEFREKIGPREWVTFQSSSGEPLCERESVQRFWSQYLSEELKATYSASCGVCGQYGPVLRLMPKEVVVMGQKCQVTSFNWTAFESFGKGQTANSPVCYPCAASAIQTLDYLLSEPRHGAALARDDSRGQHNPLRNQMAVFWLKEAPPPTQSGTPIDIEGAYAALLRGETTQRSTGVPPPDLAQLEAFLKVPWSARDSATRLSLNSFYLAVLSANKGRLVLRDWISVSLEELHGHLRAFLQGLHIVGPEGMDTWSYRVENKGTTRSPFAIPALLEAAQSTDPHLTRGLLRTAYLGVQPPQGLLDAAVRRFRVPDKPPRNARERGLQRLKRHALAAAIKLAGC